MHTILLFAAYLSATTLAIPVAELSDTFGGDSALLNGQATINNPPQDFSEPDYVGSTGQEQEGGYSVSLSGDGTSTSYLQAQEQEGGYSVSLSGDGTSTNYLQAQVPSQDTFSSGAECPAEKLFCCQGGSGTPGTLMSDAEFQGKCITYSEQNEQDDKCQSESNGSCCKQQFAASEKVWQCVATSIKVVPPEHKSEDSPSEPDGSDGSGRDRSSPPARSNKGGPNLLNHGQGNWGGL